MTLDADRLRRRLVAAFDVAQAEKWAVELPPGALVDADNLLDFGASAHWHGLTRGLELALLALNLEADEEEAGGAS